MIDSRLAEQAEKALSWLRRQKDVLKRAELLEQYVKLGDKGVDGTLVPAEHKELLPLIQYYGRSEAAVEYVDMMRGLRDAVSTPEMQKLYRTIMTRQAQRRRRPRIREIRKLLEVHLDRKLNTGEYQLVESRLSAILADQRRRVAAEHRRLLNAERLAMEQLTDAYLEYTMVVDRHLAQGRVYLAPSQKETEKLLQQVLKGL